MLKRIGLLVLLAPVFAGTVALIPQPVYASVAGSGLKQFAIESDCTGETLDSSNCGIIKYLLIFVNVLSGLVGIVVVGMIIFGGIQYSMAGDDPQKIQEAKKKISNALLGLVTFIFTYIFLQWVVPGGIF